MCSCGGNKSGTPKTFIHTSPSGVKTSYSKEGDARMAAAREGGKVTPGS